MRKPCLIVTLGMGLGLILALLWLAGAQSAPAVAAPSSEGADAPHMPAAEFHVCPSGCAYSSIQAAVDAASTGDVIKVAAGVYTDLHTRSAPPGYPYPQLGPTDVVTQILYISKTVTIRGGYTAPGFLEPSDPDQNPTTLDAQRQGHVVFVTGDIAPTIEGLRITGGGIEGHLCDLGSEPGGGMYVGSTAANIQNNRIFDNLQAGLVVEHSTVMVSDNIIAGNQACDGGGLNVGDSIATISGNIISSNDAPSTGGGILLISSDSTLTNNIVSENGASWGGGVMLWKSDATLINNIMIDNHGYGGGGALLCKGGSHRLLHNTIARNTAGDGSAVRVHDLGEEGLYSTVSLSNTVLVSHSVGIAVEDGQTVTVNGVLWHDTPVTISQSPAAIVTVQNEHFGDPAFAADGYHIAAGSAAIDKGVDAGVTEDIDGQTRPAGIGYDLGADEFWFRVYLPVIGREF